MRHRVYGKHLGRNKDERDNLFKGLAQALFTHGTIQTSQSRAKAIKGLVDKIINLAKDKKQTNKLQSVLTNKILRERLVTEIAPKMDNRTSGYTRVVRMGTRSGDQTTMVRMSLIGAEELKPIKKEVSKEEKVKTSDSVGTKVSEVGEVTSVKRGGSKEVKSKKLKVKSSSKK
ncbi:50S ribosomal protein L17 [Candidatus Daviesbacteria bacterium]|nr:50S ribosomal protein L17 [Candidatus Daviesbacteria bacterium]